MPIYINNNRLLEISDRNLSYPTVSLAPANKFQVWDGNAWTGRKEGLSVRYGDFRVGMLGSVGWGRIKITATTLAPEFMGAIAYMDDNPGMVKYLWNQIILNLDSSPTSGEIAQWQAIADSTEVSFYWLQDNDKSFDFSSGGLMI